MWVLKLLSIYYCMQKMKILQDNPRKTETLHGNLYSELVIINDFYSLFFNMFTFVYYRLMLMSY